MQKDAPCMTQLGSEASHQINEVAKKIISNRKTQRIGSVGFFNPLEKQKKSGP